MLENKLRDFFHHFQDFFLFCGMAHLPEHYGFFYWMTEHENVKILSLARQIVKQSEWRKRQGGEIDSTSNIQY